MPSFRKSAMLALGAALGISQALAQSKGGKPDDATKAAAKAKNAKTAEEAKEMVDLPIPKGQPQKGVNWPFWRPGTGRKSMNFHVGTATRLDDENVKLEKLRVQTYNEDGETVDLDMDLPDAIYNQKTKVITSQVEVKVKRADFEIVGQNMSFHVVDHTGALGGGVKMTIYDRNSTLTPDKDKQPSVEFKKPGAEPVKVPLKKDKP